MNITIDQYFAAVGGKQSYCVEPSDIAHAEELLKRVNALLADLHSMYKVTLDINPVTRCLIAGKAGGGYRSEMINSRQAHPKPRSSHLSGEGIDVFDPDGDIDDSITDDVLEKHGLYREHPAATSTWCHLQTRPPRSGKRSYYP